MRRLVAAALLACGLAAAARATTITIVNGDGSAEGFNDPTPVLPVGGNAGTTLGQQRLNVFQRAADIWEGLVDSPVEIRVSADFSPLFCGTSSAILGSAGPVTVHRDFTGALQPSTWYAQALANSLHGTDLSASDDVAATFSSNLDDGCLSGVSGWYYGLDGDTPPGAIELLPTVLHELAHGLGFLSLVSTTSGAKLLGFDDAYMVYLEDHSTGELFPTMTDGERVAAMTSPGDLHWVGPSVVAASGILSAGVHPSGHVEVYAPLAVQSGSSVSHWSNTLSPDELMEPFATPTSILALTAALMEDIGWTLVCGDGVVTAPETCDDGNHAAGDGCSPLCAVEQCWGCAGAPSVCAPVANGISCSDGNPCTGPDSCQAGVCTPGGPTGAACDDGNPCTGPDACVGTSCAGSSPLSSCIAPDVPGRGLVDLRDSVSDRSDALLWRWVRGTTDRSLFGDPTTSTAFALCVYDAVDGNLMSLVVPPGPLGRATASGFVYTDGSLVSDGVRRIVLKEGTGGARLLVRGKGARLGMTDLTDLDLPLTVQLTNGSACWEASYQSNLILSGPDRFKAKAD
jgi:cysteine-rich repeat protein